MKRTIKIGEKEYFIKSSAYTPFKYKNDTGRKLMQDLNKVAQLQKKKEEELYDELDDLIEILLKITFVLIDEADSNQVASFDDFLKNTDNLFEDEKWIMEVVEVATLPLSRGNKGIPQTFNAR